MNQNHKADSESWFKSNWWNIGFYQCGVTNRYSKQMHLLFLRRVTPDLLCLTHNSTKFCMVIKLDESLYRVHLHPAQGQQFLW